MRRGRWHSVLEGRDPEWGRLSLLVQQGTVLTALMLFSLSTLPGPVPLWIDIADWIIVAIFAGEYLLRLWAAPDRRRYAFSFWGFIDLFAFLPALLLVPFDTRAVRVARLFQLLRVFKFARYSKATARLIAAVQEARHELIVALLMSAIVLYMAAVGIWVFEREAQPEAFASVFHALWWAVATLTTVGYGDVYPVTPGGRIFTGLVLVVGLAVIAVPTGLISAALMREPSYNEDARDDDAPG